MAAQMGPVHSFRPDSHPGTESGHGTSEEAAVPPTLEVAFGLPLQLPYPLARDVELGAELGERGRLAVVEAVAPHQHVAGPIGEAFDRLLQVLGLHLPHHGVRSIRYLFVLDEVTEPRGRLLAGG